MTRSRCSFCAARMFVLERRPGRLGKRGRRLGREGEVVLPYTNVPPNSRAGLLSPSEQCTRIALAAGRRLEWMVGAGPRTRPSLGGEAVE
jgi:hypothetical protein